MAMEWVDLGSIERVVVIGAGMAGLQTVRALARAGFAVTCLEAQDDVGGVWTRNTHGYTLQVPWEVYTFPDFPYPPGLVPAGKSATSAEIAAYLQAYEQHFHLSRHIRLHSRVLEVVASPTGWGKLGGPNMPWLVRYEDVFTRKQYALPASLVVLATGQFSTPFMPQYQGASIFKGPIVHSKDVVGLDMFKGKDVVVVGSGKTGMDLVAEIGAASEAKSVTIVYKTSHWSLPQSIGDQSMSDLLLSRHTASQLPPYYTSYERCGGCLGGGGGAPDPQTSLTASQARFWQQLSEAAREQISVAKMAEPNLPLLWDLFNGAQIFDASYMEFMKRDNVFAIQGHVSELTADGVVLKEGRELPCDVLLCCTGYHNQYRFLDAHTNQALNVGPDGVYLYRGMLAPAVPNLVFVGAEVSTYNMMMTAAIQAEWLARLLTGTMALPPRHVMEADVVMQRMWRRRIMPAARSRGSVYGLYAPHYWRQLLDDMGEKAKSGSWLARRKSFKRAVRPTEVAHLIRRDATKVTARGSSLKSTRHHRLAVLLGGYNPSMEGSTRRGASSITVVSRSTSDPSATTADSVAIRADGDTAELHDETPESVHCPKHRMTMTVEVLAADEAERSALKLQSLQEASSSMTGQHEALAGCCGDASNGSPNGKEWHGCAGPVPPAQLSPIGSHPHSYGEVAQLPTAAKVAASQTTQSAALPSPRWVETAAGIRPLPGRLSMQQPSVASLRDTLHTTAEAARPRSMQHDTMPQTQGYHWSEILEMGGPGPTRKAAAAPFPQACSSGRNRTARVSATSGVPTSPGAMRPSLDDVKLHAEAALDMGKDHKEDPMDPAIFCVLASAAMETLGLAPEPAARDPAAELASKVEARGGRTPASLTMSDSAAEVQIEAWSPSEPLHVSWEPFAAEPTALPASTRKAAGPVAEGRTSGDGQTLQSARSRGNADDGPWWGSASQAGSAAQAAAAALAAEPPARTSSGVADKLRAFGSMIRRWSGERSRSQRSSLDRSSSQQDPSTGSRHPRRSFQRPSQSGPAQAAAMAGAVLGPTLTVAELRARGRAVAPFVDRPSGLEDLRIGEHGDSSGEGSSTARTTHRALSSHWLSPTGEAQLQPATSTSESFNVVGPGSAAGTNSSSSNAVRVAPDPQSSGLMVQHAADSTTDSNSNNLLPSSLLGPAAVTALVAPAPAVPTTRPALVQYQPAMPRQHARPPVVSSGHVSMPQHASMDMGAVAAAAADSRSGLQLSMDAWIQDGQAASSELSGPFPTLMYTPTLPGRGSNWPLVATANDNAAAAAAAAAPAWPLQPPTAGIAAATASHWPLSNITGSHGEPGHAEAATAAWGVELFPGSRPPGHATQHTSRTMIMHMEEASTSDMLPMISEDIKGENRGHSTSSGVLTESQAHTPGSQDPHASGTDPQTVASTDHIFSFGEENDSGGYSGAFHAQQQAGSGRGGPAIAVLPHVAAQATWREHYSVTSNVLHKVGGADQSMPLEHVYDLSASHALRRLSGRIAGMDTGDYEMEGMSMGSNIAGLSAASNWAGVARRGNPLMATYNSVTSLVLSGLGGGWDTPLNSTAGNFRRLSGRLEPADAEIEWMDGEVDAARHLFEGPEQYSVTSNVLRNLGVNQRDATGRLGWENSSALRRLSGRVEVFRNGRARSGTHSAVLSMRGAHSTAHNSVDSNIHITPCDGAGSGSGEGGPPQPHHPQMPPRQQVVAAAMYTPLVSALLGSRQQPPFPPQEAPQERRVSWSETDDQTAPMSDSSGAMLGMGSGRRGLSRNRSVSTVSRFSDGGWAANGGGRTITSVSSVPRSSRPMSSTRRSIGSVISSRSSTSPSPVPVRNWHAPTPIVMLTSAVPGQPTLSPTAGTLVSPLAPLITNTRHSAPQPCITADVPSASLPAAAAAEPTAVVTKPELTAELLSVPPPASSAQQLPASAPGEDGDCDSMDSEGFQTCPPTPSCASDTAEEASRRLDKWAADAMPEALAGPALDQLLMADYILLLQELGLLPDRLVPPSPPTDAEQTAAANASMGAERLAAMGAHPGMSIISSVAPGTGGEGGESWMEGHSDEGHLVTEGSLLQTREFQRLQGRVQPSGSVIEQYRWGSGVDARAGGDTEAETALLLLTSPWSLQSIPDSSKLHRLTGRVMPSGANALQPGEQARFDMHAQRSDVSTNVLHRLTGRVMPSGPNALQSGEQARFDVHAQRSDVSTNVLHRLTGRVMPSGPNALQPGEQARFDMHAQRSDVSTNVLHRLTGRVMPSGSNALQPVSLGFSEQAHYDTHMQSTADLSTNVLHRLAGRVMPSGSNALQPVHLSGHHPTSQDWEGEDVQLFSGSIFNNHASAGWLQEDPQPAPAYAHRQQGLGSRLGPHRSRKNSLLGQPNRSVTWGVNSQQTAEQNAAVGAVAVDPSAAPGASQPAPPTVPAATDMAQLFHAQLCSALLARNPVREALAEMDQILVTLHERLGLAPTPPRSQTPAPRSGNFALDNAGVEASNATAAAPHSLLDTGLLAALQLDIAGLPDRLAAALAPFSTGLAAAGGMGGQGNLGWLGMRTSVPGLEGQAGEQEVARVGGGRGDRRPRSSVAVQQRRQQRADAANRYGRSGPGSDSAFAARPSGPRSTHRVDSASHRALGGAPYRALSRSLDSTAVQQIAQEAAATSSQGGGEALGLLMHDISQLTHRLTTQLQQQRRVNNQANATDSSSTSPPLQPLLVHTSASSFPVSAELVTAAFLQSASRTSGGPGVNPAWEQQSGAEASVGTLEQGPQRPSRVSSYHSMQQLRGNTAGPGYDHAAGDETPGGAGGRGVSGWVDQVLTRLLLQDLDGLPERVMSHHAAATSANHALLRQAAGALSLQPTARSASVTNASGRSSMHINVPRNRGSINGPTVHESGPAAMSGQLPTALASYHDMLAGMLLAAERDLGTLASAMTGPSPLGMYSLLREDGPPHSHSGPNAMLRSQMRFPMSGNSSTNSIPLLRRLAGRVVPSGPSSRSDLFTLGQRSTGSSQQHRGISSTGLLSPATSMGLVSPPSRNTTGLRRTSSHSGHTWVAPLTPANTSNGAAMQPSAAVPINNAAGAALHTLEDASLRAGDMSLNAWTDVAGRPVPQGGGFGRVVQRSWGPEDEDVSGTDSDCRPSTQQQSGDGRLMMAESSSFPVSTSPSQQGVAAEASWQDQSTNSSLSLVLRRLSGRLLDTQPTTPSQGNAL